MFKVYQTYFQFLTQYPARLALFGILLVMYSIAESVQPYFYKLFVDAITSHQPYTALLGLLISLTAVRVTRLFLDICSSVAGDHLIFSAARNARLQIFSKLQELDFAYHTSKSTGSLISIMKRGDGAFFDLFHDLISDTTRILIALLVTLYFLGQLDPMISLIMGISFIINLFATYFLIRNNINARKAFNQSEDDISAIIVDNLINYETVKLFAKETWEFNRLRHEFITWKQLLWKFGNSFRLIDITIGILSNVGLFLILYISLVKTVNKQFTPGDFVLVLGFLSSFYPRFFELLYKLRNVAKQYTDLQKYFNVLEQVTQVKDPTSPLNITRVNGEIEFHNVTFTYPEAKKPALKNFNLKIRQGQSIALVGDSGGGKSTIVKLLFRFFDPQKGRITIDGHDIRDFTKSQLRGFFGIVPQEPVLFNNSINFNVAYGYPDQPFTQSTGETKISTKLITAITASLKQANLDTFIKQLPRRLDTNVGERGIKLSGGQKQRLAIARMILANPQIIIFDEATSSLDSHSEKLVQDAFHKASQDKTTIVIAHRLSTVTHVDQIVVIKDGQIVEKGSHRDLIHRQDSFYRHFWELQTKTKSDELI